MLSLHDHEHIWRLTLQQKAIYNPEEVIVLSSDDTETLDMPHLTNRDKKRMTHDRIKVIPFNLSNHVTRGTWKSFITAL